MSARIKAGVVVVIATLVVAAVGILINGHRTLSPTPTSVPDTPAVLPLPTPVLTSASVRPGPEDSAWFAFRERFGASLSRELAADGSTIAIRGTPGKGTGADGSFRSEDAARVQARAQEILTATGALLGLQRDLPLGDPLTRVGAVSAQVHFHETWQGMPLEPVGSVVVDLGSQGELLNLSADYVREIRVTGSRRLSASDAKQQAEAAVTKSPLPTTGGRPIVWVTRGRAGEPALGRQAYDYDVGGRQIVIDSESGKIIFNRDRRQY